MTNCRNFHRNFNSREGVVVRALSITPNSTCPLVSHLHVGGTPTQAIQKGEKSWRGFGLVVSRLRLVPLGAKMTKTCLP